MKKTISINISGIVFNIEEDAYDVLKKYLDTIAGYFTDSDGRDEIMTDIEARIAELFQARLSETKNVVGMQDVQEVIDVMGRPEDYLGEEEQERAQYGGQSFKGKKRLYRDDEKNLVGGVCSGISHYMGWDPLWMRLAWGLSIAVAGVGVLPYIILWIIVPAAKTTTEKLEMMGEPVNVESIKKKVNETVSAFREAGTTNMDTDFQARYATDQVKRGGDVFVDVLKRFVRFIGRFLGFGFFVGGVAAAAFLIYSYFDGSWFDGSLSGMGVGFSDLNDVIFTSSLNTYTFAIGSALVSIVPLIGLILLGARLLFSVKSKSRVVIPTMIGLWVIGLVMLIIAGLSLGKEFTTERYTRVTEQVADAAGTLYLEVNDDNHFSNSYSYYRNGHFSEFIEMDDDSIYCGYPELDIVKGMNNRVELEIEKVGRGFTPDAAKGRSERIVYNFQLQGDTLKLDPFFSYLKSDKFRAQELELTLRIPRGKEIYISERVERILDHASTSHEVKRRDLIGHTWVMTNEGLMDKRDIEVIEIPARDTIPRLDQLGD